MALAEYFSRNALAAAQVMSGYADDRFRDRLEEVTIGVAFGASAETSAEGRWLCEVVVRLVSRLYPKLTILSSANSPLRSSLEELAKSINPLLEFELEPDFVIVIGEDAPPTGESSKIYAGSKAWDALVSTIAPVSVGRSDNPLGAAVAACFACANLFRAVFLSDFPNNSLDRDLVFSTLDLTPRPTTQDMAFPQIVLKKDLVLVGLGAIGNSAAWVLSNAGISGRLHLVDHEEIELSNLQRYMLATTQDIGRQKVEVIAESFTAHLEPIRHSIPWSQFVSTSGYDWANVLVAVDSARDRIAVQASLPEWIANAWTQPGDIGLSVHHFLGRGACLACLYLPSGVTKSKDEIVALALGLPERLMQVRELLYSGQGVPRDFLDAVAEKLGVANEKMLPFEGRPISNLYVEGVCGGAIIPLEKAGQPTQEVHVPLAFQSCLAGTLLGAAIIREQVRPTREVSEVTRVNLLHPLGTYTTMPALKDARGICICQDSDYISAYERKHSIRHPSRGN